MNLFTRYFMAVKIMKAKCKYVSRNNWDRNKFNKSWKIIVHQNCLYKYSKNSLYLLKENISSLCAYGFRDSHSSLDSKSGDLSHICAYTYIHTYIHVAIIRKGDCQLELGGMKGIWRREEPEGGKWGRKVMSLCFN